MRRKKDALQIEPRVTDVNGGCKRANVGKDRFYELLHTGEIESYLDGRSRKVVLASVDAYIDRQITGSKGSFQRARHPTPKQRGAA
jgi:excisionase family DNA binding protein